MHRSQPNRLHDELDALLDGRPVELTEELAPLVEAADALRAELAAHQLDPAVADRHLELVLGGPANVVRMPGRPQSNGWDVRRRVAAVVLAAALVLAPATMASAAALPGQAMYPFKLAIEQLRLASVGWSPSREAGERTRVAHERLREVNSLLDLKMYNQLPMALKALKQAVLAAEQAVADAQREGEPVPGVLARLTLVKQAGGQMVEKVAAAATSGSVALPDGTRDALRDAVEQTQNVLPPPTPQEAPGGGGTGTSTTAPTAATQTTQGSVATGPTSPPNTPSTTNPPEPSTSQAPTTTAPTTTTPSTTEVTTTEGTATPGSSGSFGAGAGGGGGQGGPSDNTTPEQAQGAPPTTSP
jgi:hypothetical protein